MHECESRASLDDATLFIVNLYNHGGFADIDRRGKVKNNILVPCPVTGCFGFSSVHWNVQ